jgi:hypothetical protein
MSSKQNSIPAVSRDGFYVVGLEPASRANAKRISREKNLFDMKYLSEQVEAMMGEGTKVQSYRKYAFSYKDVSYIFGISSTTKAKKLHQQGLKRKTGTIVSTGRPSALTVEQDDVAVKYVLEMQKANTPLTPVALLEWVNETFKLGLQQSWPFGWVKQHQKQLCITNAVPLELARAELTRQQLLDYANRLKVVVKNYDWRLVSNWDETGLSSSKNTTKSVIVDAKQENKTTYYKEDRPSGHITVLPVINLSNYQIPPLIILSQKTIDTDLSKDGFPNSPMGMVVSTTTGFINEGSLLQYIHEVVGPEFYRLKRMFDIADERILLLQDSMSSHVTPKVKEALEYWDIDTFEIPAHSSHITQILDQYTFHAFKSDMKKKFKPTEELSARSIRILNACRSMQRVTTYSQNLSAFKSAGFTIDLTKPDPLGFDPEKLLKKDRVPAEEVSVPDTTRNKVKQHREKVSFFKSKGEISKGAKKRERQEKKEEKEKKKKK